jgi:glycosyltransferase involved in cell wall biosynthesis
VNERPSKLHFEPSSVKLLTRARRLLASRGLADSIAFLCQRFVIPRSRLALSHRVRGAIRKRPGLASGSGTLIVKSTLDYAFPYQQRPHHLARAFHRQGLNVVFVTPSAGYDRVAIAKEIRPGLLLTPDFEAALTAIDHPIVYTSSTDASLKHALMQEVQRKRGMIIYDYIDAMDSRISSGPLSNSRMELHASLLREAKRCVCVATSLELFQEVTRFRSDGVALVENGVDVNHFAVTRCPSSLRDDLRQIVSSGSPIAGYFGALAHWLDYDLVMAGASALPCWNFVLIGIDYDGSCRALNGGPKNIHVLPPIPYRDLPENAIWFDAALIPFKINEITMATSPLKLFEYMALGLPTISTPIQESLRYKPVIIARDAQAFVDGISTARQKRVARSYQRLLQDEASTNSWDAKASTIIRLLDQAMLKAGMPSLVSRLAPIPCSSGE